MVGVVKAILGGYSCMLGSIAAGFPIQSCRQALPSGASEIELPCEVMELPL